MRIVTVKSCSLSMALALALLTGTPAQAAPAKPLPVSDQTPGLYQRVLSRPAARLLGEPRPDAQVRLANVPALSIFYVFARQTVSGKEWVQVGRDSREPLGWIDVADTVQWNRALAGVFSSPADREPVLFFRKREDLEDMVKTGKPQEVAQRYRSLIDGDVVPKDFPVIAREPSEFVDPKTRFYLLPILENENAKLGSFDARLLRVAAVRQDEKPSPSARRAVSPKDFKAGVVFVIDTSISMGKYIERTREAVRSIYKSLRGTEWADNIAFGLVAYRNTLKLTPKLEYDARKVADLSSGADEAAFFREVDKVTEAGVPSPGFDEEAYQGIMTAVTQMNWEPYQARYVVLVTDAGARDAGDPESATKMDAEALRSFADKKAGIRLLAIHLLTAEGKRSGNHESAERQYRKLTADPSHDRDYYFPIERGSQEAFARTVGTLAKALTAQMSQTAFGEAEQECSGDEDECRALELVRAFALEYLGKEVGAEAPSLIEAWAADHDLGNPVVTSLQTRVLLSRDQVSGLYERLRLLIEQAMKNEPESFFDRLGEVVGGAFADPARPDSLTIGTGLAPFLAGLPYKTELLNLTQSDWIKLEFYERNQRLQRIGAKLALYRKFYDDQDLWIKTSDDRQQWLYPMPLTDLP